MRVKKRRAAPAGMSGALLTGEFTRGLSLVLLSFRPLIAARVEICVL